MSIPPQAPARADASPGGVPPCDAQLPTQDNIGAQDVKASFSGVEGVQELAVCVVDRQGIVRAADEAALVRLLNAGVENSIIGRRLGELVNDAAIALELDRLLGAPPSSSATAVVHDVEQAQVRASVRMRLLVGEDGPMVLVEFCDEARSTVRTRRDPLTQLADRDAIAACIDKWRRTTASHEPRFALLFLDLDDFKKINDSYGHAMGDRLLQTLAARWLGCVRESDLVTRYGGDEFVVLVKDATSNEEAAPIIRRLQNATREPIDVDGRLICVSATIGVSTSGSGGGRSLDDLLAAADRDMYAQKRSVRD